MSNAAQSARRRPWPIVAAAVIAAAALAAALRFGPDIVTPQPAANGESAGPPAERALRYDAEYPDIGYSTAPLSNSVSRLEERLAGGAIRLDGSTPKAALASLLQALDIGVASQVLVFSKTSLQTGGITAATPRAIYFNDDTYVAAVQGAESFELAAFDPNLGAVFYSFSPQGEAPRLERQFERCLRCHDSYSLTGGGVPRFITGSGYTNAAGQLVSHEGWILTSDRTPLRSRWGGWYVSGYHGAQVHLGNMIIRDFSDFERLEELRVGNLADLDGVLDTSGYLTNRSDIVALLILEHQVRVQNALTRASYDTRTAIAGGSGAGQAASLEARIAAINEPLVEALLLVGEAPLSDRVVGTSGFADEFQARGPRDADGRSLRDLDLTRRLFKYPLSYLIHSEGFDGLPAVSKQYVYRRLGEVLTGADRRGEYAHLSAEDRSSILAILAATAPELHAAAMAAAR